MFNRKRFEAILVLSSKTVEDVAEYLGINVATMYRKMNGTSDFYRSEIQQMIEYLAIENPMEIFFAKEVA